MRKIKFRGKDQRGNVFYGAYNQKMGVIEDEDYSGVYAVDSADQLVCIEDGKEYYEGDVKIKGGCPYKARLVVDWEYVGEQSPYTSPPQTTFDGWKPSTPSLTYDWGNAFMPQTLLGIDKDKTNASD